MNFSWSGSILRLFLLSTQNWLQFCFLPAPLPQIFSIVAHLPPFFLHIFLLVSRNLLLSDGRAGDNSVIAQKRLFLPLFRFFQFD